MENHRCFMQMNENPPLLNELPATPREHLSNRPRMCADVALELRRPVSADVAEAGRWNGRPFSIAEQHPQVRLLYPQQSVRKHTWTFTANFY